LRLIIDIVFPLFGVGIIGYLAARLGAFGEPANRGLSLFVFYFATPALLFRSLVRADLPAEMEWGLLLSYFLPGFLVFALAMGLARRFFGRPSSDLGIVAMGACFGNTVLIGIPICLATFGEAAAVPLFLILAFHGALFYPTVTTVTELGLESGALGRLPWITLKGFVGNPIIMSLLAGYLWNLWGPPLPMALDSLAELLGQAAIPCALFATGASLSRYRIAGNIAESLAVVGLKLFVMPALVWVLAAKVFTLPATWVAVAVILAALPSGVNVYIFAERYGRAVATATTTVFLATVLSMITLPILLLLLAPR
jgi:malonate transporter